MTDVLENLAPPQRPPAARRAVALLGVGTAVPLPVSLEESIAIAEQFSCDTPGQRAWLRRVFSRAGVRQRGSVLMGPAGIADIRSFYPPRTSPADRGPTTAARMVRYAQEAPPLAQRAARAALADAGLAPEDVTHLITISCTGFFAPGLDVALINGLGLSPAVGRVQVGFMGCHAAFNALAAARAIVLAQPEARVLVCSVELSTLHFAYGWDPEKLVASALFADGASACIVGAGRAVPRAATNDSLDGPRTPDTPRWHLRQTASLLLPNSRDAMTWQIGDHGFAMTLSAELPALIKTHLRHWCESWLEGEGLTLADITHWAIHPGGPKIIAAAAESLALPDSATTPALTILAEHGNMSSATLLFLLQHIATPPSAPGYCVALGFGPGLMAEGMLLELD